MRAALATRGPDGWTTPAAAAAARTPPRGAAAPPGPPPPPPTPSPASARRMPRPNCCVVSTGFLRRWSSVLCDLTIPAAFPRKLVTP